MQYTLLHSMQVKKTYSITLNQRKPNIKKKNLPCFNDNNKKILITLISPKVHGHLYLYTRTKIKNDNH